MITRTCRSCQKDYQTFPSIKPLYCSTRCVGLAKRKGTEQSCAQCGAAFWRYASTPDKRYCSKSCALTARNLTAANPARHRDLSGANNPMFGRKGLLSGARNGMYGRRREQAPQWRGGRKTRPDGYQRVMVPDDYPNPCETDPSGAKYALEHRVVMEHHLGRYLTSVEVVHHLDLNPSNNALANLELFASHAEHMRAHHNVNVARKRIKP